MVTKQRGVGPKNTRAVHTSKTTRERIRHHEETLGTEKEGGSLTSPPQIDKTTNLKISKQITQVNQQREKLCTSEYKVERFILIKDKNKGEGTGYSVMPESIVSLYNELLSV